MKLPEVFNGNSSVFKSKDLIEITNIAYEKTNIDFFQASFVLDQKTLIRQESFFIAGDEMLSTVFLNFIREYTFTPVPKSNDFIPKLALRLY